MNNIDPDGRQAQFCPSGCTRPVVTSADLQAARDGLGGPPTPEAAEAAVAVLLAVEGALIAGDIFLGGPTGEGIGPAMGIRALRESTETAMQRGVRKEAEVLQDFGLPKNNTRVSSPEGNSIPDALTDTMSIEIKDCASVCNTRQMRIQAEAAQNSGRQPVLVTGTNTNVSKPVQETFEVIRREDLGPQ